MIACHKFSLCCVVLIMAICCSMQAFDHAALQSRDADFWPENLLPTFRL